MNRRAATAEGATGAVRSALAALLVLGLALVLVLLVRARPSAEVLDPRSSAATGATAVTELLARTGGEVRIERDAPAPADDVRVLVLVDALNDDQRNDLLDFVEAGGVAVVADPASTLHGGPNIEGGSVEVTAAALPQERLAVGDEANLVRATCNIAALDGVRGVYLPDGVLFPVGPTEPQCLGRSADPARSYVVVRTIGTGRVVGLGGNLAFTNQHLRRADNAGLIASLVTPTASTDAVILLGAEANRTVQDVGTGDDTLIDLVPASVWMALVLGGFAFVVFAVSRAVRPGKVLDEPLVTPIAANELVAATGNLMQRAKHAPRAGWLLQSRLHRDLCAQLHVDPAAPLDELDRTAAERAGTAPGAVETLLRDTVHDERSLLALSARIDRLRKDVTT